MYRKVWQRADNWVHIISTSLYFWPANMQQIAVTKKVIEDRVNLPRSPISIPDRHKWSRSDRDRRKSERVRERRSLSTRSPIPCMLVCLTNTGYSWFFLVHRIYSMYSRNNDWASHLTSPHLTHTLTHPTRPHPSTLTLLLAELSAKFKLRWNRWIVMIIFGLQY